MNFKKSLQVLPLVIPLLISPLSAQRTKSSLNAGEQRHAQKSLKDNRYFIKFINPTISNRGTDNEIRLYEEAIRHDLIGRILYMKFSFHNAFVELKKSQLLMIELYKQVILYDVKDSRNLLNNAAPEILKNKEHYPKKYLSLGYRSSKWAERIMVMADNLPERNYSIRLYEYSKAVKRAKFAKRYAILALIESRLEPENKRKMKYNRYNNVRAMIDKYLDDRKEKFQSIHRDNFYLINPGDSVYDKVMSLPELETIPEYAKYMDDE